jgi:hypothetical protein
VTNERTQRRWLFSGGGFQSSSPPIAHFAWPADGQAAALRVIWPDGFEQRIDDVRPNQRLNVSRP